jgi:hypothetical protein
MPPQLKQDTVYSDSIIYSRAYGDSTYLSNNPVMPLIGGQVKDTTIIKLADFPKSILLTLRKRSRGLIEYAL